MIDLTILKDFLLLCDSRSFSKAAEQCHVSISGLSRRVQTLEQWFGTNVFVRGTKTLEVTEAGQRLRAVASEVVYAMEGVRKTVQTERDGERARVRFAAPHIMSALFFVEWIPRLHQELPDIRFTVDSDHLGECIDRLHSKSSDYVVALLDDRDLALDRIGLSRQTRKLQTIKLGDERMIPVSAPGADGSPAFSLATAKGGALSFLAYREDCHLGWSVAQRLEHAGLNLARYHQASLADGIRQMALSGLGVAWLPFSLVREELQCGRLLRAGDATYDIPLQYSLLRLPSALSPQAERLWSHLSSIATPTTDCGCRADSSGFPLKALMMHEVSSMATLGTAKQ
jgi:DNA-binding transcriptional LysR family regulator